MTTRRVSIVNNILFIRCPFVIDFRTKLHITFFSLFTIRPKPMVVNVLFAILHVCNLHFHIFWTKTDGHLKDF